MRLGISSESEIRQGQEAKRWLVLVDIDHTLADSPPGGVHPWQINEWRKKLTDPIRPLRGAQVAMVQLAGLSDIAILSGRPEHTEQQTRRWLVRHYSAVPLLDVHLCPAGVETDEHKQMVYRRYRNRYADRICVIDDQKWKTKPTRFYSPPAGWQAIIRHIIKNSANY